MAGRITRREFFRKTGIAAGGLALSAVGQSVGPLTPDVSAQEYFAYLPLLEKRDGCARVVHVRAPGATSWDFQTGWYGSYVNQAAVNGMMDLGLAEVTGASSVADAWGTLMPDYQPGQKIAVKVNLNNARSGCSDSDTAIDALIEVVNSLIRSLSLAGVQIGDVMVYDALRPMPARFYNRRIYTAATYLDSQGCADALATFDRVHNSLRVNFSDSNMPTTRWLTDILHQATYVINMPILKRHGLHPVTLGFKNHFGSLHSLGTLGSTLDNPHYYINPYDPHYDRYFSPLVDINANANLAGKTVLTIGDGLFGAPGVGSTPVPWKTFGGQASDSLLFSRDPVAIDCVMCDLLRAEWGLNEAAYDYLSLAQERGLGTFERGDPWGSGYNVLCYTQVSP